jgi:DNA-binding TFAR19-related protein (PDSD5 family)
MPEATAEQLRETIAMYQKGIAENCEQIAAKLEQNGRFKKHIISSLRKLKKLDMLAHVGQGRNQ